MRKIRRGLAEEWIVDLLDEAGRLDGRWSHADEASLSVRFWPGQSYGYFAADSVAFVGEPLDGARVRIGVGSVTTAQFGLGRLRYVVLVGDRPVLEETIEVVPAALEASPGGDTAPFSYVPTADFLRLARSMIASLGGAFDEANLLNLLAASSRRFQEIVATRWGAMNAGPYQSRGYYFDQMLGWLVAEGLRVDQHVVDWVVFDTIAYLAGMTPVDGMQAIAARAEILRDQAMMRMVLTIGDGEDGSYTVRFTGPGGVTR
jgi:hypothetical protein